MVQIGLVAGKFAKKKLSDFIKIMPAVPPSSQTGSTILL